MDTEMISTTELRGLIQANETAGWSQLSFRHSYLLELADRIDHLEAELTAVTRERDSLRAIGSPVIEGTIQHMAMKLTASQAYAAQLRDALVICKREMKGDKWDSLYIDGVLAKDKP
jgi:hypothetical protein